MYNTNDGYGIWLNTENGIVYSEEMTKLRFDRESERNETGPKALEFVRFVRTKPTKRSPVGSINIEATRVKVQHAKEKFTKRFSRPLLASAS